MVRMMGGVHAGEVRNLPFIAARGAILSGMARQIVDGVLEPAPIVAEMVVTTSDGYDQRVTVAPPIHHKRPGRRR